MMKPSNPFTSLVMDAPAADPRQLEFPLLSPDAIVAAIREAIPDPSLCVDDFSMCPDLVSDNGSSPSANSLPCSPQSYDHSSPRNDYIDCGSPYSFTTPSPSIYPPTSAAPSVYPPTVALSFYPPTVAPSFYLPTTSTSPPYSAAAFVSSPDRSAARVLVEAPCAGGKPIRQKGGGYICSSCNDVFKRRDDAKRHIDSAGIRLLCKYCGKPGSRRDSRVRHIENNKACLKAWKAGYNEGRFTVRSEEDAYN